MKKHPGVCHKKLLLIYKNNIDNKIVIPGTLEAIEIALCDSLTSFKFFDEKLNEIRLNDLDDYIKTSEILKWFKPGMEIKRQAIIITSSANKIHDNLIMGYNDQKNLDLFVYVYAMHKQVMCMESSLIKNVIQRRSMDRGEIFCKLPIVNLKCFHILSNI